ncbi:MAG: large conductance mechanosensitive channel protein MscL [Acholeplasmataceae bacterium]|nr:large conductance mechanosensitive channel protein MscL [Acholeplasmataceae bacterium]
MKKKNKEGFFQGFKKFISRGNVLDLAVGVVIGGAFGKIVSSLVNHIIMPLIAAIFGGKGVEGLYLVIRGNSPTDPNVIAGLEPVGAVLYYGEFLQTIIDFLIIAFFIYLFIVVIIQGSMKRAAEKKAELLAQNQPEEEPEPEPEPVVPEDIQLLTEIRDQLRTLNEQKK